MQPTPVATASTSTSTSTASATQGDADWANNPHISFDKSTSRWIYEDPSTGKEFEYHEPTCSWRETVDEDAIDRQQDAYKVEGVDENEIAQDVQAKRKQELKEERKSGKKRKAAGGEGSSAAGSKRVNSSLFISNLPLDATVDEVASVFSRYGIVSEDDEGNPRIKLYTDEATKMFKGEALLSFFKPESCALAIQLLDGTCLREALGQRSPAMKVEMADWSRSTTAAAQSQPSASTGNAESFSAATTTSAGTDSNASAPPTAAPPPPPKKQRTEQEKRRAAKRFARMNDKLMGWDSDSEEETVSSIRNSIHTDDGADASAGPRLISPTHPAFPHSSSRSILLKHLFTPQELQEEPELLLEIKDDIREECNQFGSTVTSVVLYDLEEEGIVSVKFAKGSRLDNGGDGAKTFAGPAAARAAARKMNGRYFAGKTVLAYLVEGKIKGFKRSDRGQQADDEGDDDPDAEDESGGGGGKRDGFGTWLQQGAE